MQPLIGDLQHEEFWVLYLNNNMKVVFKSQLSKGGISGTVVDLRMIFKMAFEHNATAIILVHNHPSGNNKPSDADFKVTNKIKIACNNLEISLVDHVIITQNNYYSFKDSDKL